MNSNSILIYLSLPITIYTQVNASSSDDDMLPFKMSLPPSQQRVSASFQQIMRNSRVSLGIIDMESDEHTSEKKKEDDDSSEHAFKMDSVDKTSHSSVKEDELQALVADLFYINPKPETPTPQKWSNPDVDKLIDELAASKQLEERRDNMGINSPTGVKSEPIRIHRSNSSVTPQLTRKKSILTPRAKSPEVGSPRSPKEGAIRSPRIDSPRSPTNDSPRTLKEKFQSLLTRKNSPRDGDGEK